jgi:acyl dehydratase
MTSAERTPAMRRVVQRGLYFEELDTGAVYVHSPGRTVGEADNTLFTTLTMNAQSLHLDANASASNEFGQRLVNSMFTLSTLIGLSVAQLTQATTVANLGFSEITFPRPVFVGDTLYAETMVLDKRLSSSRPGNGVVIFEHIAYNQRREVVAVANRTALMMCLPAGDPAEGPAEGSGGKPAAEPVADPSP